MTPANLIPSQIAPDVYHFDTYPFNWYVVEEAGKLTLIDAGWPGHYNVFKEGLRAIGRSIKDVEAILLTHAHSDHVGFAGPLSREANIPVFVHKDDADMAKATLQLPWYGLLSNAWRPHMAFNMLGHAILNGLLAERGLTNTYELVEGQTLELPGHPQVMHIPGHTPGEVVIFLPKQGVLFTGDTLVTEDLRSGVPGTPQFPHIDLNGKDKLARRSIDKLKHLAKVMILPGHGKPWHGLMPEAIAMAQGRL